MLKRITESIPVIVIFLLLTFSGCSKKNDTSTNPVSNTELGSMTLNGDSYNNSNVNFIESQSVYQNSQQQTICLMYGLINSDSVLVEIIFPGSKEGNYQWVDYQDTTGSLSGVGVYFIKSGGSYNFYFPKADGNTKVTIYGDVGKTIEGSFSGTVEDAVTSSTISVSGTFKSARLTDE